MESELEILYRDPRLIAINKPSGLLVHRSAIDRHETRFAIQLLRDQIGQRVYPLHRLDKPTSGVLLFALDSETAREMMAQFQQHTVEKRYLAVVRGYTEVEATIDYALKEELDKTTDRKARQDKEAQSAVTHYRRLATAELPISDGRFPTSRYSLIEAKPETGRKHQIRRHMKHIFHPIVGDTSHGDGRHNRIFRDHFKCHRLLLAASELAFTHPSDGKRITLRATVGDDYSAVLAHLSWRDIVEHSGAESPHSAA
ncbi:hypothetical protein BOW53_08745 [Solemya pervernicosa gill symbiont]|uniref:tRNA pseudouridine synthase C n=2 Tax=Gammaproteobacteria incertae sedis TaxID=118884 RepID=A0A1T2L515_9GAMM|nr:tRNA pseudouridine(65) synthase TruC [Candidatus Reidiella endopervernicosa]OOZ40179.1 hypothetical protein BOW53_08745 [Solemya pervernicosa gill symbiont]QKQ25123.1 tRNA pseudouridine(65) synthase TruC [Candidatus Reidiella endopervernicosa]